MKALRFARTLTAATLAAMMLTASLPATPVAARSMPFAAGQYVNVNVGFNTRIALADSGEDTLLNAQQSGRKLIYTMASRECAVLLATIAATCRLANLNVTAQVREHGNMPVSLHLNGNAQFAITLKDQDPG